MPLRVREGDAVLEGLLLRRVRVADTLGLRVCDGEVDPDRLRVFVTEGEEETVVDRDRVEVTVPVGERVCVGDPLGEREGDGLVDIVRDGDVVAVQEKEARADAERVRDGDPELVGDRDCDPVVVIVAEEEPERLRLGLPDVVALTDPVREGDAVADQENDAREDADRETVWETLAVGERDRVGLTVPLPVVDPDRLRLGLPVPVGLRVSVGLVERVCVEDTVVEGDRVMEGDPLDDTVGEIVRVFGVRVDVMEPVAGADAV